MPDIARFGVRFDEEAFLEDLAHATVSGRTIARQARERFERDGVTAAAVKPCLAEGPDGTQLPGCVKVYLPPPGGPWGMVLRLRRERDELVLYQLAFGLRHPSRPWQPSVYQVAHRRLHGAR